MFLKVFTPNEEGGVWQIVGDISTIYHYRSTKKETMADVKWACDIDIFAIDNSDGSEVPVGGRTRLFLLSTQTNGKKVSVISDFPVYLCNEEGKTIDKL